jgi:hypothetical protein
MRIRRVGGQMVLRLFLRGCGSFESLKGRWTNVAVEEECMKDKSFKPTLNKCNHVTCWNLTSTTPQTWTITELPPVHYTFNSPQHHYSPTATEGLDRWAWDADASRALGKFFFFAQLTIFFLQLDCLHMNYNRWRTHTTTKGDNKWPRHYLSTPQHIETAAAVGARDTDASRAPGKLRTPTTI